MKKTLKRQKPKGIAPRVGSAAAAKQRTIDMKAAFLKAYEAIGTVTGAAAQVNIDRTTVYQWFEKDAAFGEAFKASQERAVDLAEQELRRRGIAGYDKPVFQQGKRVGLIREYSDACLIFYLKGRRRDVFGDKRELTGPDGGPIPVETTTDLSGLTTDELQQMRHLLQKARRTDGRTS